MDYKNLDCYKVCLELTLTTCRATDDILKERQSRNAVHDDDIIVQLRYCTTRATGRIAFACGSGDKRVFRWALHQAMGFLYEFGCCLEIVRTQELVTPKTCQALDALRGRGLFYLEKLIFQSLESA